MMETIESTEGKVLIVDDDPVNLGVLGPILRQAGYSVLAAQSVDKVLPMIKAKRPDIILLDVSMPIMNGYDLCKLIHEEPGTEHIPVIFITGKSGAEDVIKGFIAGGVDYLLKPINRVELLRRMRTHLERQRFEQSLAAEKLRFQLIAENAGEAFILMDDRYSEIRYANPAFAKIFGFELPAMPVPTKVLGAVLTPEQRDTFKETIAQALEKGTTLNYEMEIVRHDGSARWIWARSSKIRQHEEGGVVLVVEDITERKSAELRLRENLKEEAALAGTIQQSLLMKGEEVEEPGVEAHFISIPSRGIDGDFYDVFSYAEGFDVIIGDVMGKGLNAALIGVAAKARFLRALAKLDSPTCGGSLPAPTFVVENMNRNLAGKLIELNSFLTFQYLRFMRSQAYLEYIDCGHMPLVVWDGESCWSYKGANAPIGFLKTQHFESFRIPLKPGYIVLAYSDGITEAKSPAGEYFGERRLLQSIREVASGGSSALVEHVLGALRQHLAGAESADDVTMVAIGILPGPGEPKRRHANTIDLPADLARLTDVRAAVKALLDAYSPAEIADTAKELALLAADEAAANIITHGLGSRPGETLRLTIEGWETWYSIRFRYQGEEFDWSGSAKSNVENFDENGYGQFIIKSAMQSYTAAHSDTGLVEIILAGTTEGTDT